ncbi:MAG: DUF1080 domain-containing protein [Phycisphaerales bacterium]|jgi:glucose/arabinose dehydrogenase|nr:DUF1080 domain-containing protein [Phycisphaerales bacterium]
MRNATPAALLLVALLAGASPAQTTPTDPGFTFRVYQIANAPDAIPVVMEGQTPNHDSLRTRIDISNDEFGGFQAPFVTHAIARLMIERAGSYAFRITSDDGSRLSIDGKIVLNHDGLHGATSAVVEGIELDAGAHDLLVEHFDGGGSRMLRLEWRAPGARGFEVLDSASLRAEQDITRVTSPGFKRVEGERRPGDMAPLLDVHPGWTLSTIHPDGYEPKVGAMAFLPDGRLAIGTFDPLQRDEVSLPDIESKEPDSLYAIGNLDAADPNDVTITRIAGGLYEPMGLCVADGELYVAHRRAVERLRDVDGDGFFETHEIVGQGWEGWNYHQFAMGLLHRDGKLYTALSTSMAPPDWEGMLHNAGPNGPMRGCLIEIDIETGDTRALLGGLRTPNGLGWTADGSMIYLDNQGTWMPTNQLVELIPGRFYGHYNWTNFVPKLADRFPEGGVASALCDYPRTPATVLMAQNEVTNSPTQPLIIEGGLYDGQLLVGELTAGGIRRVFLERVEGQLQGALFRFTQGLESGVNRMAWGPDGSLYIGGIGAGGNWNWKGTQFGLQRLTPNNTRVFEMHRVEATSTGFRIHFTKPIDPAWLADPEHFAVSSWTYTPTVEYGGPKIDEHAHAVRRCEPDSDGASVAIDVAGLEAGRCYYIRTDPTSVEGDAIWSTEAWYTLNHIPRDTPIVASSIGGAPITPDALGVGIMPKGDAVTLVRKGVAPSMRYGGKAYPDHVWSQDELIASDDWMPVGAGSGDLVSATEFADARLHVEWFSPPGGAGQLAGNSGVYLQDRYEIQVLATPAGDAKPAPNEAGALYNIKPADVNASTGPGTWQAYDIWFRAPRFKGDAKVEDARITLYWNGVLVHNDVAIPSGTGSARDKGEAPAEGQSVQIGPLRLQDHASGAEGPVRFRNVWIEPLGHSEFDAGPWTQLFEQEPDGGWMIRGGNATYAIQDGVLVGTSTPHSPNTFYTTARTFRDFELTYEVLDDPRLNSGVQIRSHVIGGADNRAGNLRGYQIEIDPGERAFSAGVYDEARRGWLHPQHTAPYARRAFRPGEWNEFRVVARGPVIRTWINGVPAAEVFDAADAEGHIGFQVHDVGDLAEPLRVRFRNARIRELRSAQ